jgi:superfamily I DNA/RNA helicase
MAGFDTQKAELDHIVGTVRTWLDAGLSPDEIGIATRAKQLGEQIAQHLRRSKIPVTPLAKKTVTAGTISVGTMHRMKGLEFRAMIAAGVSESLAPAAVAVTPEEDDVHTHTLDLQRERCLLFVACTRAREQLVVTWHGAPSPFLAPWER